MIGSNAADPWEPGRFIIINRPVVQPSPPIQTSWEIDTHRPIAGSQSILCAPIENVNEGTEVG
eukprot:818332-Pyramimonas_sp.AAC.1